MYQGAHGGKCMNMPNSTPVLPIDELTPFLHPQCFGEVHFEDCPHVCVYRVGFYFSKGHTLVLQQGTVRKDENRVNVSVINVYKVHSNRQVYVTVGCY